MQSKQFTTLPQFLETMLAMFIFVCLMVYGIAFIMKHTGYSNMKKYIYLFIYISIMSDLFITTMVTINKSLDLTFWGIGFVIFLPIIALIILISWILVWLYGWMMDWRDRRRRR